MEGHFIWFGAKRELIEFGKAVGPVLPAFIAFPSSRGLEFVGVCVMRQPG